MEGLQCLRPGLRWLPVSPFKLPPGSAPSELVNFTFFFPPVCILVKSLGCNKTLWEKTSYHSKTSVSEDITKADWILADTTKSERALIVNVLVGVLAILYFVCVMYLSNFLNSLSFMPEISREEKQWLHSRDWPGSKGLHRFCCYYYR